MLYNYILLHACSLQNDILVGLALCLLPFLLGWLAASAYYKVGTLRGQIAQLTADNTTLQTDNTDLRVKLTQEEAEIQSKSEQLSKAKSDLMLCQSSVNALKEQLANATAGTAGKPAPPKTITFAGAKYKWDDLKIVEGIGPKIADLLIAGGIKTWNDLAGAAIDAIQKILDDAGPNYTMHNPASWPQQASLAAAEDWDGLKKLQDELTAGRAD